MEKVTYQFGNTVVHVDLTYINHRTQDQVQKDQETLDLAMWAIVDELLKCGETA